MNMKRIAIISIVFLLLSAVTFLFYWFLWRSDFLCKDLDGLTITELEERLEKTMNPCCKCELSNHISFINGEGSCKSCCDNACGY